MLTLKGYAMKQGVHGGSDEPAAVVGEGNQRYFMTEKEMVEAIQIADKVLKDWGSDPSQREMLEGFKRNRQFYSDALEGLHKKLATGADLGKPIKEATEFGENAAPTAQPPVVAAFAARRTPSP
jgi:hypothetical protein